MCIVDGEHVVVDLSCITIQALCCEPGKLWHRYSFKCVSFESSRQHDAAVFFKDEHVFAASMTCVTWDLDLVLVTQNLSTLFVAAHDVKRVPVMTLHTGEASIELPPSVLRFHFQNSTEANFRHHMSTSTT